MASHPISTRAYARANALARWALVSAEQRSANTEAARRALQERFAQAVDQALPGLAPEERAKRIAQLKSAYYQKMHADRMKREREAQRAAQPKSLHPRIAAVATELFGAEV